MLIKLRLMCRTNCKQYLLRNVSTCFASILFIYLLVQYRKSFVAIMADRAEKSSTVYVTSELPPKRLCYVVPENFIVYFNNLNIIDINVQSFYMSAMLLLIVTTRPFPCFGNIFSIYFFRK